MDKLPSALLDLFRSRVQGDLLALLYLHPGEEYSITEAAQEIGASVKAVRTEVQRMVATGVATDRHRGQLHLVKSIEPSRLASVLTDLVILTSGPLRVLTDLLRDVPGIEAAYIFGSWAARYQGEPGPVPNDIDLLIIGDVPLMEVHRIANDAEERLRREVNPRRVQPEVWASPPANDTFLTFIKQRPLVEIPVNS